MTKKERASQHQIRKLATESLEWYRDVIGSMKKHGGVDPDREHVNIPYLNPKSFLDPQGSFSCWVEQQEVKLTDKEVAAAVALIKVEVIKLWHELKDHLFYDERVGGQ